MFLHIRICLGAASIFALFSACFLSCTARTLEDAEQLQSISLSDTKRLVSDMSARSDHKERVVIIEQLLQRMRKDSRPWLIPSFLGQYVQSFPDDPYNAYYLFLVGKEYERNNEKELAALYYQRAVSTGSDILVQGNSIHLQSIQQLLNFPLDPIERIDLYHEMLSRFSDVIDKGSAWYFLARSYEEAGLYPQSFDAYAKFLDFPATVIPGKVNEQERIRGLLAMSGATMDWTRGSLDQLLAEVRTALNAKDYEKLISLQAKVNFFSMSWLQEKADFNSQVNYDLRRFVQNSSAIYTENTLEGNSNSQEAYLKTWGWSPYMPIWYLYFRRVDYPANPEVNGNWEWVGIYFGNSLQ